MADQRTSRKTIDYGRIFWHVHIVLPTNHDGLPGKIISQNRKIGSFSVLFGHIVALKNRDVGYPGESTVQYSVRVGRMIRFVGREDP